MLTKKNVDAIDSFASNLEIEGRSLWQDARIRFMRNKAAMVSLIILLKHFLTQHLIAITLLV